ncbi:bacterio-opsin activator HTH domain-containing protein [Halogeometricum pallidum JCM 14848]|uniref:Bacterio-opsin activator HTH domain-containing protein n=1 Tax=Halogeometricum pallidum JCM 14848 TaxID=1227487 RepID=M0CWT0_HALPD|nr:helix-turn-helix domain-containing protein [Halogeometricum pallidum]ELZ27083.1 bacterio-opsin activator HTH domain-containing protein [Halogeometricum pallidum JCM 14848]
MATEATFTVRATEFPLGSIFEEFPAATVELERVVPNDEVLIPYAWVYGVCVDDVEAAFSSHPGVRSLRLVDAVDDQYLLRVEWDPSYRGVLSALAATRVPLLEAVGTSERWLFRIRGDKRHDVAAFYDRCQEWSVPVTMTELHSLTPRQRSAEATLTDAQREALVLAYERGYFDTPRGVTMAELGSKLGISQQAVGSRIRRGINCILGETLSSVDDDER